MSDRFIRRPEVARLTALSSSTLRRMEIAGTFPRRRQLGANSVAWSEQSVLAWLESRKPVDSK